MKKAIILGFVAALAGFALTSCGGGGDVIPSPAPAPISAPSFK